MTWDTGNHLRRPVLTLDASIIDNAQRSVQRVKTLAGFNSGDPGFANTGDMKRLRGDAAEAAEMVEEQKASGNLGIPSPVRDNLLNALTTAKTMLEDPEVRPALNKAYAPQFVHETVRQLDEAYTRIDVVLNPPQTVWEETRSGDHQAAFDF